MRVRLATLSAWPELWTPARCWRGAPDAARTAAAKGLRLHSIGLLVLAALALGPAPAQAATAGNITVATQDVYRGDQGSKGDPVVTLGLHHEDISGFYIGGNVTVAVDQGSARLASGSQYAGFSLTAGRTTIELGVIHRTYRRDYSDEYEPDFTEAYIGVSRGSLTGRIFLSPRYVPGRFSVYTEVDAEIYSYHGWSLSSHAGLRLTSTSGPPIVSETTKLDGSLRLEKTIGKFAIGATVTDVASRDGVETPRVAIAANFAF
jgi:uncharacterized protein (TIGR02001 family)